MGFELPLIPQIWTDSADSLITNVLDPNDVNRNNHISKFVHANYNEWISHNFAQKLPKDNSNRKIETSISCPGSNILIWSHSASADFASKPYMIPYY